MIKDGVLYTVDDYCHFAGILKSQLADMLGMSPQSLTRYIKGDRYSISRVGNKVELISTKIVRSVIIEDS